MTIWGTSGRRIRTTGISARSVFPSGSLCGRSACGSGRRRVLSCSPTSGLSFQPICLQRRRKVARRKWGDSPGLFRDAGMIWGGAGGVKRRLWLPGIPNSLYQDNLALGCGSIGSRSEWPVPAQIEGPPTTAGYSVHPSGQPLRGRGGRRGWDVSGEPEDPPEARVHRPDTPTARNTSPSCRHRSHRTRPRRGCA
jgi:hypothetical protein